ncbi:MAG: hypothetical protein P1P77_11790 [Spirochaetaceae bacterium]|nr:hypothetical protein [Spirochaetaceae bacterium]
MKKRTVYSIMGLLILSGLTGCGKSPEVETTPISITVSDAAHGGADNGFYILPPLVAEPTYSGVFDPNLSPTISIPALGIEFTTERVPDSEYIRVDEEEELYIVNWKTEPFEFDVPGVYRMSFNLGEVEIGFIEIEVFETLQEVVSQGDIITTVIQPGRTIPIKFRIETEPAE